MCTFDNLHQNHKILKVSDEEGLKKENLSAEILMNDFDKIVEKGKELKNKIEKEINDINKLYDKTINDITKTYKRRHEELEREELQKKEKLDNEVTKVKEKLENFLSSTNNELKISERVNKGIKNTQKEEKNMIKILSYISKINKNKKGFNSLFQELMYNIKPSFNEKENEVIFDEYYFNGSPIPNNIECKDNTFIGFSNIEISWKINDIKNLDKNKFKFRLELKKENEDFQQIYEGDKYEFIINNLKNNTKYEIRICCIYNGVSGIWSEIFEFTTKKAIDSNILSNSNQKNEFLKKIYEWSGCKSLELLFRGTRDGMYSQNFHEKCDDKGPTITLFRNDKGNIFGGYLPISWKNTGEYQNENRCFIFTLTNIYNIQPTKFESKNNGHQVYFSSGKGPCFYDTWIRDDFINNSDAYFNSYYQDTTGKGNSMFTGNSNNNERKITLNEVEVYKII